VKRCGISGEPSGKGYFHDFRALPAATFQLHVGLAVGAGTRRVRPEGQVSSDSSTSTVVIRLLGAAIDAHFARRSAAVGLGREPPHAVRQQARSFGVIPSESVAAKSALRGDSGLKITALGGRDSSPDQPPIVASSTSGTSASAGASTAALRVFCDEVGELSAKRLSSIATVLGFTERRAAG